MWRYPACRVDAGTLYTDIRAESSAQLTYQSLTDTAVTVTALVSMFLVSNSVLSLVFSFLLQNVLVRHHWLLQQQ